MELGLHYLLRWKHSKLCWLCRLLCQVYPKVHENHRCSDCDYPSQGMYSGQSWVWNWKDRKQSKHFDLFNRIFHHIIHIIPGSGTTSCYDIDISHGPKRSKKGNRYFIERYRQITTHTRKAVIAVNALDESSSWNDASWTANATERARTLEN